CLDLRPPIPALFPYTTLFRSNIINDTEHANNWGRQNWLITSLVVEGDVTAGDWDIQFLRTVSQTVNGLAELPHHVGVFWRTEVQAVGHRIWSCAGHSNVAVCLSQRQTCTHVWVQLGVATGGIGRNCDTARSFLIDTQNAGVRLLRLDGVTAHVAVILLSDKCTR